MQVTVNIFGEKYDFSRGAYNFLDKQIKRSRKEQKKWKKIPRPSAFSIRIEPKDMVIVWRIIEVIFLILFYIYVQFMRLFYFFVNFFKSIFG